MANKIFQRLVLSIILLLVTGALSWAKEYGVDPATSTISFSGTHAGQAFSGKFEKWNASISVDFDDLAKTHIAVEIDTASAKTGNALYDGTLPQADWFDVKNFPQASFVSTQMKPVSEGTYQVDGELTLRGQTKPFSLTVTMSDIRARAITATARFPIDRLMYDIGKTSDPKAEWVSKEILVEFSLTASAQ
jgi:cytochrome b561